MKLENKRALLVINRQSTGKNEELPGAIEILKAQGVTLIPAFPATAPECDATIRRRAAETDLIIIGGGDGTLNATAEAVVESGLPLGILPLGTANDLARTLNIPSTIPEACRVIAAGHEQPIDVGCVNGKLFFNVASLGLSVKVTHHLTPETKRRWGALAYSRALLDVARENRSFRAEIRTEERIIRLRAIQITVGNGRYYGGGSAVAHNAAIDDHQLALYALKPQNAWTLLLSLPALRKGRHEELERVLFLHGARFEIRTEKQMAINTDGELTRKTPARFSVIESALRVFTPSGDRERGKG